MEPVLQIGLGGIFLPDNNVMASPPLDAQHLFTTTTY